MRITSAFFADHVAIYEGKLNALGAVWSYYMVEEFPAPRNLPVALIAQLGSDDVGRDHHLRVVARGADGMECGDLRVDVAIAGDYSSEYLCLALNLGVTLTATGRHVVQFSFDDEPQMALPLDVKAK